MEGDLSIERGVAEGEKYVMLWSLSCCISLCICVLFVGTCDCRLACEVLGVSPCRAV